MAKINWQRKAKELDEENDKLSDRLKYAWEEGERAGIIIFLMIVGVTLCLFILFICGEFDSPFKELNINEQFLARNHVLTYYPEFENCSITYDACGCKEGEFFGTCIPAAKIYCDEGLDDRDNLKVKKENIPNEIICFEDLTVEELFLQRINYMRK